MLKFLTFITNEMNEMNENPFQIKRIIVVDKSAIALYVRGTSSCITWKSPVPVQRQDAPVTALVAS